MKFTDWFEFHHGQKYEEVWSEIGVFTYVIKQQYRDYCEKNKTEPLWE